MLPSLPPGRAKFQSTLPVWGATLLQGVFYFFIGISIHAPRVGSDSIFDSVWLDKIISIHAPRVGSDATNIRQ